MEPCQTDYFPKIKASENTVASTPPNITNLFCLADDQATLPEDKQNLQIKGLSDQEEQGRIILTIERCKVDCLSTSEIDNLLRISNIAIYQNNNRLQLKNKTEPFQFTYATTFLAADTKFTKLLDINMKLVNVKTDSGYIMKEEQFDTYVLIEGTTESISSEQDQVIFSAQLQMVAKIEAYERTYKKVYSIIAEIGGYIKAFVIFAFLYRPFLKRMYYMEIINNLYRLERNKPLANVQIGEDQERKIQGLPREESVLFRQKDLELEKIINDAKAAEKKSFQSGEEKKEDAPERQIGSLENFENNQTNQPLIEQEKEKPKAPETQTFILKYNWMDWIAIICPCLKTKKHKLLDKGKEIVENNTDITVIIRKLQEFELLKKIILDKDQEILFNKLPKPNLLEIVDHQEKQEAENRKSLGEELQIDNVGKVNESAHEDERNPLARIDKQEKEREVNLTSESGQIQELYNKLNRDRNKSAINDKLLTALEEYVLKHRQDRMEEEQSKQPRASVKRPKKKDDGEGEGDNTLDKL